MEINNSKLYSVDLQKIVDFWTDYSLSNIVQKILKMNITANLNGLKVEDVI